MQPAIYLLKLRTINIYNLPLALLYENDWDHIYDPCRFVVNNQGFLDITTVGDFAKSQTPNPEKDFRYINWSESLSTLDYSLNQSIEKNKYLVFGSYCTDQLDFLKNHYGKQVLSIGINYQENFYPYILKHKAKHHVHLLSVDQSLATELDKQLFATLSLDDLIAYYSNAFDQQNLIPHSDVTDYDYNINIEDFFNKSLMLQHFSNIGVPFTPQSEKYYDLWLRLQ